jgi:hypothetical protein
MEAMPSGPDLSEKDTNSEIAAASGGRECAEIDQHRVGTDEQRQKLINQESELRNIIKEMLREKWEEFVRLRQKEREEFVTLRQQEKEESERLRQREKREMEEMFERLMDKFTTKSITDLKRLDSKFTNRLEGETGKLVKKISSLQEDAFQEISSVRNETERVNEQTKESLNVSLKSHKLEAKRN